MGQRADERQHLRLAIWPARELAPRHVLAFVTVLLGFCLYTAQVLPTICTLGPPAGRADGHHGSPLTTLLTSSRTAAACDSTTPKTEAPVPVLGGGSGSCSVSGASCLSWTSAWQLACGCLQQQAAASTSGTSPGGPSLLKLLLLHPWSVALRPATLAAAQVLVSPLVVGWHLKAALLTWTPWTCALLALLPLPLSVLGCFRQQPKPDPAADASCNGHALAPHDLTPAAVNLPGSTERGDSNQPTANALPAQQLMGGNRWQMCSWGCEWAWRAPGPHHVVVLGARIASTALSALCLPCLRAKSPYQLLYPGVRFSHQVRYLCMGWQAYSLMVPGQLQVVMALIEWAIALYVTSALEPELLTITSSSSSKCGSACHAFSSLLLVVVLPVLGSAVLQQEHSKRHTLQCQPVSGEGTAAAVSVSEAAARPCSSPMGSKSSSLVTSSSSCLHDIPAAASSTCNSRRSSNMNPSGCSTPDNSMHGSGAQSGGSAKQACAPLLKLLTAGEAPIRQEPRRRFAGAHTAVLSPDLAEGRDQGALPAFLPAAAPACIGAVDQGPRLPARDSVQHSLLQPINLGGRSSAGVSGPCGAVAPAHMQQQQPIPHLPQQQQQIALRTSLHHDLLLQLAQQQLQRPQQLAQVQHLQQQQQQQLIMQRAQYLQQQLAAQQDGDAVPPWQYCQQQPQHIWGNNHQGSADLRASVYASSSGGATSAPAAGSSRSNGGSGQSYGAGNSSSTAVVVGCYNQAAASKSGCTRGSLEQSVCGQLLPKQESAAVGTLGTGIEAIGATAPGEGPAPGSWPLVYVPVCRIMAMGVKVRTHQHVEQLAPTLSECVRACLQEELQARQHQQTEQRTRHSLPVLLETVCFEGCVQLLASVYQPRAAGMAYEALAAAAAGRGGAAGAAAAAGGRGGGWGAAAMAGRLLSLTEGALAQQPAAMDVVAQDQHTLQRALQVAVGQQEAVAQLNGRPVHLGGAGVKLLWQDVAAVAADADEPQQVTLVLDLEGDSICTSDSGSGDGFEWAYGSEAINEVGAAGSWVRVLVFGRQQVVVSEVVLLQPLIRITLPRLPMGAYHITILPHNPAIGAGPSTAAPAAAGQEAAPLLLQPLLVLPVPAADEMQRLWTAVCQVLAPEADTLPQSDGTGAAEAPQPLQCATDGGNLFPQPLQPPAASSSSGGMANSTAVGSAVYTALDAPCSDALNDSTASAGWRRPAAAPDSSALTNSCSSSYDSHSWLATTPDEVGALSAAGGCNSTVAAGVDRGMQQQQQQQQQRAVVSFAADPIDLVAQQYKAVAWQAALLGLLQDVAYVLTWADGSSLPQGPATTGSTAWHPEPAAEAGGPSRLSAAVGSSTSGPPGCLAAASAPRPAALPLLPAAAAVPATLAACSSSLAPELQAVPAAAVAGALDVSCDDASSPEAHARSRLLALSRPSFMNDSVRRPDSADEQRGVNSLLMVQEVLQPVMHYLSVHAMWALVEVLILQIRNQHMREPHTFTAASSSSPRACRSSSSSSSSSSSKGSPVAGHIRSSEDGMATRIAAASTAASSPGWMHVSSYCDAAAAAAGSSSLLDTTSSSRGSQSVASRLQHQRAIASDAATSTGPTAVPLQQAGTTTAAGKLPSTSSGAPPKCSSSTSTSDSCSQGTPGFVAWGTQGSILQQLLWGFPLPALETAYLQYMYRHTCCVDMLSAVFYPLFSVTLLLQDGIPASWTSHSSVLAALGAHKEQLRFMLACATPVVLVVALRPWLGIGRRREWLVMLAEWWLAGIVWSAALGVVPMQREFQLALAMTPLHHVFVVAQMSIFKFFNKQVCLRTLLLPFLAEVAAHFVLLLGVEGTQLRPVLLRYATVVSVGICCGGWLEISNRRRFLRSLQQGSAQGVASVMQHGVGCSTAAAACSKKAC